MKIKTCPFCGSADVSFSHDKFDGYMVTCAACFIDGPVGDTVPEAISKWNERVTGHFLGTTDIDATMQRLISLKQKLDVSWPKWTITHLVSDAAEAIGWLQTENRRLARLLRVARIKGGQCAVCGATNCTHTKEEKYNVGE